MSNFVFISYSKRDLSYAQCVSDYLNEQSINTWLFDVQYSNGRWWDEIVSAIYHCAAIIPILSPESQTSRWVQREINLGLYWKKPAFSLLLEGDLHLPLTGFIESVKPPAGMPSPRFVNQIRELLPVTGAQGHNVMGIPLDHQAIANDVSIDFESLKRNRFSTANQESPVGANAPDTIDTFDFQWCSVPAGEVTLFHHFKPYTQIVPAFEIARYPVTCAQFAHFVNSSDGYYQKQFWTELGWHWKQDYRQPFLWDNPQWNRPDHPVVGVSWHEALAFCAWLEHHYGQATKMHYRLQSETQFIRAVQGPHSTYGFPWGDETFCEQANTLGCGPCTTTPVNQYDAFASFYGVCDLVGNVWEWCIDKWETPLDTPQTDGDYLRVVRGGSWNDHSEMARCQNRFRDEPDYRGSDLGFRIVRWPRAD